MPEVGKPATTTVAKGGLVKASSNVRHFFLNSRQHLHDDMGTWNEETEEQMISMIQERPALYSTKKRYETRGQKSQLWREVESTLATSEKEIRRRWNSLRTQYNRYKKQGATSESFGAQTTERQQRILTRLQFLEPHTKRKGTPSKRTVKDRSEAATDSDSSSEGSSSSEAQTGVAGEEPGLSGVESSVCGATGSSGRPSGQRARRKRSRKTPEEPMNMMRVIGETLEGLASRDKHNDGIAAYCRNIEHRMRKLPPRSLPHFQHEVDTCLFKYSVSPNFSPPPSKSKQKIKG